MEPPLLFLFLLLSSFPHLAHSSDCYSADTTWDADSEGTRNISTKEDCQMLCFNSPSCHGFTHFNDNAQPHANYCETFSSPSSPVQCENCISGPKACTCSGKYTCSLSGSTVLGLDFGVETEEECAQL